MADPYRTPCTPPEYPPPLPAAIIPTETSNAWPSPAYLLIINYHRRRHGLPPVSATPAIETPR